MKLAKGMVKLHWQSPSEIQVIVGIPSGTRAEVVDTLTGALCSAVSQVRLRPAVCPRCDRKRRRNRSPV